MPPRPPFPISKGMPQQMNGFGRNNFGPMMTPSRMGNVRMGRASMGANFKRGARGGTRQAGGGGLLAKILGKGNAQGSQRGIQAFGGAGRSSATATQTGGLLKSLTDPTAISGFLNNTQRVLNTAQQIGPMVQQYGPLVKNLPAIWKLYRGFNTTEAESDVENETNEGEKPIKRQESKTSAPLNEDHGDKTVQIEDEGSSEVVKKTKGKSVPKIYV